MHQLADELSHGNLASELGKLIRDMAELSGIESSKKDLRRSRNHTERSKNPSSPQEFSNTSRSERHQPPEAVEKGNMGANANGVTRF